MASAMVLSREEPILRPPCARLDPIAAWPTRAPPKIGVLDLD